MYLQRLIADPDIGFNYDLMGHAEFENGVTRQSRAILAQLNLDKEISAIKTRFFARHNRICEGPIDVFVFGASDTLRALGLSETLINGVLPDFMVTTDKSSARFDNSDIIGWMSVNTDQPVLIIRANSENLARGDQFLQPFMNQLIAAEQEGDEHESYAFENGWTLRRTWGPVVLPANNGVPIEGNGFWVMFDGNGNPVDRDKYFNDITERLIDVTGDPIPVGKEREVIPLPNSEFERTVLG